MHVAEPDEQGSGKGRRRAVLDAVAGALAGCVARLVVGPLDVIKIRFQVQLEPICRVDAAQQSAQRVPRMPKYTGLQHALQTIVKEEGIQGLWRGTVPGLLLTVPYTAVQFVALQQVKEAAARFGLTGYNSTLVSFGSGAMAGAAATIASYPFDLLRTTLAAQGEPKVYRGMLDAARSIVAENGIRGLYRGVGVTLVEIVPYAALQFGLYDAFNAMYSKARAEWASSSSSSSSTGSSDSSSTVGRRSDTDVHTKLQYFTCGLLAGLLAKLATHPLDVAKKRFQVAGLQRSLRYGARIEGALVQESLLQCLAQIYRNEGVRGLWKGSLPSIIKSAPNAAITFTAYEAIVAWLLKASGEAQNGSGSKGSSKSSSGSNSSRESRGSGSDGKGVTGKGVELSHQEQHLGKQRRSSSNSNSNN